MLGGHEIELIMSIAESGIIENAMADIRSIPKISRYFGPKPNLKSSMKDQLKGWKRTVKRKMVSASGLSSIQQEFALYQEALQWNEETFNKQIPSLLNTLEETSGFYSKAKKLVGQPDALSNPMFSFYFCEQWFEHLQKKIKSIQMKVLNANKEELIRELYQQIETMQSLEEIDSKSDSDSGTRIWDMSKTKLTKTDIKLLKSHAQFLQKNSKLQQIADQLGRMAIEQNESESNQQVMVEELVLSEQSCNSVTGDIVGIHESDDLNRMLPNEVLFLTYPELEVVFYKHLIDKRLLSYQSKDVERKLSKVKIKRPLSGEGEKEQGPFIICIDGSGSMKGFPEQCAKALAYGLMQIAMANQRECFVIMFSTEQITYELTKQNGLREVSDFLAYSFHGGTDLEPALQSAIDLMKTEKYKNADLLVISDFIASKPSIELIQDVDLIKQNKNRFHAATMSKFGNPEVMAIFDHIWPYHPSMLQRLLK
jgi:uncharacterized protein with von Willebrand factor type A (vWA) domain